MIIICSWDTFVHHATYTNVNSTFSELIIISRNWMEAKQVVYIFIGA
jgi:hypothetical protein